MTFHAQCWGGSIHSLLGTASLKKSSREGPNDLCYGDADYFSWCGLQQRQASNSFTLSFRSTSFTISTPL